MVNYESITKLNTSLLLKVCQYLNVNFNCQIFTEMNLDIEQVNGPGDWALNISKALKAKEYINPLGSFKLFNKELFERSGIKLSFFKMNLIEYNQGGRIFEPGLSILDAMMFNTVEKINLMLDNYELI